MLPNQVAALCYEPLRLDHKPMFDAYLKRYPFDNSEMTFADLYIWRKSWGVKVCVADGTLIIRVDHHGKDHVFYPILGEDLKLPLHRILQDTEDCGRDFMMKGITSEYKARLEKAMPGVFTYIEDRDFHDYVYELTTLQTLAGKKLHGKRNHIKRFLAENDAEFHILKQSDNKECMELYDIWLEEHKSKQARNTEYLTRESCLQYINMLDERNMVEESLKHREVLGLEGGVVRVSGKVEAFTIGEQVRNQFIVHLEKANTKIEGLFTYVNQSMVQTLTGKGIEYVNREEDMGIEGLRKAKRSYRPIKMVEKYTARRRECA